MISNRIWTSLNQILCKSCRNQNLLKWLLLWLRALPSGLLFERPYFNIYWLWWQALPGGLFFWAFFRRRHLKFSTCEINCLGWLWEKTGAHTSAEFDSFWKVFCLESTPSLYFVHPILWTATIWDQRLHPGQNGPASYYQNTWAKIT